MSSSVREPAAENRAPRRRPLPVVWTMLPLMLAATATATANFTLDDQFDRPHPSTQVFDGGPVLILAGAQRETPDAMKAWEDALRPKLPTGTALYGLSNLKRLPFFVPKGAVRKTLKEKLPNTAVLCDWKGKVYPALGFAADATIAVGVFTAAGERLGSVDAEASTEGVRQVLELLRAGQAE